MSMSDQQLPLSEPTNDPDILLEENLQTLEMSPDIKQAPEPLHIPHKTISNSPHQLKTLSPQNLEKIHTETNMMKNAQQTLLILP